MKTVAVIGSNSFSGGDFIDLLLEERDYRVLGISRSPEKSELFLAYQGRDDLSNFEFHQIDLNDDFDQLVELFDDEQPEYVVNFAAQGEVGSSWKHPEQWFQTNAVAIAELANYLKDQPWLERYVHISTPEVYGTCEGSISEDAPINPSTPYAASKAAGDLMLFTLVKQHDFPLVMIRATNIYGAHQQLYRIMPRSAIYLKMDRTIELHGGGVAVKSYIHIRDVSRGELAAMENGTNGLIYHLSPDESIAVRDVVRTICERMGRDFDSCVEMVSERPGQDKAYVIDSSRAREQFGWAPQISFEDGIAEVVEWVENNWEAIESEELEYVHQR